MSDFQLVLFDDDRSPAALPLGGVDDMNFVELLHNLPGKRRPPKGKTISVPWKRGDRSYYVEYSSNLLRIEWKAKGRKRIDGEDFYVQVETPESKGLPTNIAGDVLVALMKFAAEQGAFKNAEIRTNQHKLLQFMKWHTNGHYYKRLRRILSQFTHMTVSTNALWDPGRQRYYAGEFNILDSWKLEESEDDDPEATLLIRWGQETLDIFERGYMKHLDTELYYDLPSPIAKRIYRWLDKHLSLYPVVEIDVLRFAHKVLGYGVSYKYPSKVLPKLSKKLDEIADMGFCHWETQPSQSDSGQKLVFTRLTDYSPVTLPRREYIVRALADRGVDYPELLVDEYDWERCLRQLAYYEWRLRNGKEIQDAGGWLSDAIRRNHRLPKPLAKQMERARDKTADWCEQMYAAMTTEDREQIDDQVRTLARSGDKEDTASRRLQLRNRLLLSKVGPA